MSTTKIPDRLFNTVVRLERRTTTLDSIGDFTEVWTSIVDNIKASIQPTSATESKVYSAEEQGREYTASFKIYFNRDLPQAPLFGDRVVEIATGKMYPIIGVNLFRTPTAGSHHYKLYLEIPRETKS
jgi:head-tail adaptor